MAGDTGNSGVEVFTTGGQDGAVGPKALVFHHHGHITQDVPLPLFVQAFQHVGTVHCRLKGEHWDIQTIGWVTPDGECLVYWEKTV